MTRPELDDLKARVDLVEVIRASGVTLKKNGKSYKGQCPFHAEDSPSFSVTPEAGLWHCFGCQAGGDVFRFFQLKKECSFPEALAYVRELAGEPAPPNGQPRSNGRVLTGQEPLPGGLARAELLGSVAQRYAEALRASEPAQAYLEKRGLGNPELAEAFGLGFADGSLLQAVPAQGEVRQALEQLGLISREGRELFAGCLVVPLTHPELGTLSLYGRKLSPRAQVRHLYLPGPKRGVLNWQALAAAPARVTLTESVLDALSVWAAGERSVTCLFGVGGLPPDLEEALRRFAVREVQLCLDADETGQEAARRLAERLTGQGLRCWHVPLPAGVKDPNQLLCEQGSTALREALSRREAFPDLAPPLPETPPLAPQRTDEGLRLAWDGLAVTLALHPPFKSRLRVTLRVERGDEVYRHTFELSSYRNRAQAARDLGRRFSREAEDCERFLLELLELAEGWVDEWRAGQEGDNKRRRPPPMSEADRQEALAFLSAPDLVERILADMEALGTVGETRAKLLTYLIAISRKLEYPLSGILASQSAAGKSGIAELVEALCPAEEVVWYSRLSPMALYNMAADYLKRKFVMVEESLGSKLAEYPIRILQSRHKLTQVVTVTDPATGKMRAQENEVEGPIAYLETTTAARQVNYENATRCFLIHLDESEEQTRRIHAWQRRRRLARVATESVREPICRRHQNAQRLLEFAVIRIPYVEALSFPSRWLRTRRDHERFLCLIEAVAFLHQFQRPQSLLEDGTRCIEAQVADYRIAYELAQDVLAQTLHELSRDARELLALVAGLVGAQDQAAFTRRDLRENTQWQDHRLRDALDELVAMEYLHQVAGGQGRTSLYQLAPGAAAGTGLGPLRELTTPDELERLWPG